MSSDEEFDLFVSYARADNVDGWITTFVEQLMVEHLRYSDRGLKVFFDKTEIGNGHDWQHRIAFGVAHASQFVAFVSPNYFISEWCRREWQKWIDTEIAKHILTEGAVPIYIVEVPGLLAEESGVAVAEGLAGTCTDRMNSVSAQQAAGRHIMQMRRKNLSCNVQRFYSAGAGSMRRADFKGTLRSLAEKLQERHELVDNAKESQSTVPAYNRNFTGRVDELLDLRERLCNDPTGVVHGIGGIGGIGKSELAFTYSHAYAHAYPGGRFYLPCEGKCDLKEAVLELDRFSGFYRLINEEERKQPDLHFSSLCRCLDDRLREKGAILLIMDNVDDLSLLSREQTDLLTCLGDHLHLLATTRLSPPRQSCNSWKVLTELSEHDAVELLRKFRDFTDESSDGECARLIAKNLGGFTLAVELTASYLANHSETTYQTMAGLLGVGTLEEIGDDDDVVLRRHNHEKRLSAIMNPLIATLSEQQTRVVEYAALLPPDCIALPWLEKLIIQDFPMIGKSVGLVSNPWKKLWRSLEKLSVFMCVDADDADARLVRMHRLLQGWVRDKMDPADLETRRSTIDELVNGRTELLGCTTKWNDVRWELAPLESIALLWAEENHSRAAELLNTIGRYLVSVAEWSRAEMLLQRALDEFEEQCGVNHPSVSMALNNLSELLCSTGRFDEAEPCYRRALEIDQSQEPTCASDVARDLRNLARLLRNTNRFEEAEPLYIKALEILETDSAAAPVEVAATLNNYARLLENTNRFTEAEPLIRRALGIHEDAYGEDHPKVAVDLNSLADILRYTERLKEAESLYFQALAVNEKSYGKNHPEVARNCNNLGNLCRSSERYEEAQAHYRRALKIYSESFDEKHPYTAVVYRNLGKLAVLRKRPKEAEKCYLQALEINEGSYGTNHPLVGRNLDDYATLLLCAFPERKREAERLLLRAHEIANAFKEKTGRMHRYLVDVTEHLKEIADSTGTLKENEAETAGLGVEPEEWLQKVDAEGNVLGKVLRSDCHSGKMILHPVIHLHVINEKGEIFLQKRSMKKFSDPGKWDTAVAGHIAYGETVQEALEREAFEEIGLEDFSAEKVSQYVWEGETERQLIYVFIARDAKRIIPESNEVDDGYFWSIEGIEGLLGKGVLSANFEYDYIQVFRQGKKQSPKQE